MQHKNTTTSKPIKMNKYLYKIINLFTWFEFECDMQANERMSFDIILFFVFLRNDTHEHVDCTGTPMNSRWKIMPTNITESKCDFVFLLRSLKTFEQH